MSDIEVRIKSAERAVKEAFDAHASASKQLDELYRIRSSEKFGIAIGMRVRSRNKEYVVTGIHAQSWTASKPWLSGKKIKKNGAPGELIATIYGDWEIVS